MESTKYLLIGGGLACAEAAKQIRRLDERGGITMVSDEPNLPYNRPPLSKGFLRGEEEHEGLLVSNESDYREQGIETLLVVRAEGLDPAAALVSMSDGRDIRYEKLLIATGGSPVKLALPGADLPGIHYLRTLEDSRAIAAEAAPGKRAVIVGAGFIGLEVAASLTQLGVEVTVVEAMPRIWPRFADEKLASVIQGLCEERGVSFRLGQGVNGFGGDDRVSSVAIGEGDNLACDFACVGVGIRPNVQLAQAGGLDLDNGVVVDEFMHASHPNVFAAGDVANYFDPVFGKRRRVEHWGHAEYSGQVAGMNMAGEEMKYDLLTYVWSDIFDLHLEFAGDEAEHDEALVRGSVEERSFTQLYLKQGLLRAYFSINTPAKEFPILQRLIKRKKDVSGSAAELQDPEFNLRTLL